MPEFPARDTRESLPVTDQQPLFPPAATARTTERSTIAVILLLGLGTLLIYPAAAQPGPRIAGLTAFFSGILVMGHGCVAWLAIALARADGNPAVLLLGTGYLASALLAAPYMAVFPDALIPGGPLVGSATSATWLFTGLNFATGIPSLAAALMAVWSVPNTPSRKAFDRLVAATLLTTVLVAIVITALALGSGSRLPPLVVEDRFTPFYTALNVGILALHGSAALLMLALRGRMPVFAWAAVAHVAACLAHIAAGAGGMRYTIGWTYGRISYTLAALVVLIYFLQLFARQQKALATANSLLEARVAERTADLATMVNQRDTLLREVYHRVRNNLAIVDSLAHFQLRSVASPDGRAALEDMRNRVQALAILHEQLVEPIGPGDTPAIDLRRFLETLCQAIAISAGADQRGIEIVADVQPRALSPDVAAPLGMIVSELVTNAIRHAFPQGGGSIRVSANAAPGDGLLVTVEDSGTTGGTARFAQGPGLGGQIVKALTRQLGGKLETPSPADNRSRISLRLP